MRVMFALPAGGPNYIGRSIPPGTIDFLLSSNRDAQAAKRFFQKALRSLNHPRPRGINVDGEPVVSEGHYRTETYRRTGPRLPVPAYSLLEQYRGGGSPRDQAPSQSQFWSFESA